MTGARLKHVAEIIAGQSPPSEDVRALAAAQPFIQGNAEFGRRSPSPVHECDDPPKAARAGDLLVSVRAPVGAVNFAEGALGIGRGIAAVRPSGVDRDFAFWWLQSSKNDLDARATGTTFTAISASVLGSLVVPVADRSTQRAIAGYLDRETARIDELIAEQEALLPQLDQRRISELDEVMSSIGPSDRRLKQLSTTQTGLTLGKDHGSGEELPYLRVANVQAGSLDLSEISTVLASPSERQRHSLRDGDVLMTEGGDLDKLGRGAVWRGEIEPCLHQNHVFAVRCGSQLRSDFLTFWMESAVSRRYFRDSAKKTTNLASINATILGNMPLSLPSLGQQDDVVSALGDAVRSTSLLRREVEGLIALLKERRAALITAAVTGEIDVSTS